MPYTVSTKLGSAYLESFAIADGTTNTTSTSIPLIGSSAPPGYAKDIAKSLVTILSNGASNLIDRPTNALIGQEWFDFSNKTMMVYTGASTGWKNMLTEGSTNLIITPTQGGLGFAPTSASAGYVVRVNSSGSGYELAPGSFVRTDASSSPLADNTHSIGSSTAKYKEIFATTFNGNALTSSKWATTRSITLTGDIAGTVNFDGSGNVSMPTTLVGGQLSAYIRRTGDTMDPNCPLVGGIGVSGGFIFPQNAYGGSGDYAGMQLVQRNGEDTVLSIFNRNDPTDAIQFNSGSFEFYGMSADGVNSSLRMLLTKDGRVGINTTTPSTELDVNGGVKAITVLANNATITSLGFTNASGTGGLTIDGNIFAKTRIDTPTASVTNFTATNLVSSTSTTLAGTTRIEGNPTVTGTLSAGDISVSASDRKLKTNIQPIQDALGMLKKFTGHTYDFDLEKCAEYGFVPMKIHEHGLIAQEVISVLPDAEINNGQYLNYRDRPVLALVVSAINQLDMKLEEIKKTLGI